MKNIIVLALILGFSQVSAIMNRVFGQSSVHGKVTDKETGEPILVGTVALYDVEGDLVTGTDTDYNGDYVFRDLESGFYSIGVSYVGYRNSERIDFNLELNTSITYDVQIEVGVFMPDCHLILSYEIPLIDLWDTTSGRIFTSKDIQNLPVK